MCLGMHLARMESRLALDAILQRLHELRLDPKRPAPASSAASSDPRTHSPFASPPERTRWFRNSGSKAKVGCVLGWFRGVA